jgi:hypothetical protein
LRSLGPTLRERQSLHGPRWRRANSDVVQPDFAHGS